MTSPRLEQLLGFLAQSPNEPFILFAIAKEHEKIGNLKEALHYYQLLETTNSSYVGTYYHLGKLYEKLEQDAQAFATYQKGMKVAKDSNDNHSFSELAGAKMELGDEEDFMD